GNYVMRKSALISHMTIRHQAFLLCFGSAQVPALRQAGAALENHLAARRFFDNAQGLGDEVILFDDRLAQAPRAEMLRRADNGLLEVGVFKQLHGFCAPSLAIPARAPARQGSRNQTGRADSNFSAAPITGFPADRAAGQWPPAWPEHAAVPMQRP